jgi:hypothetical protein
MLNSMLGDGKGRRPQRIDGSKLPEYDMVRRYPGPAGMTMTTEETGWLLTGFTLTKEVTEPAPSEGSQTEPATDPVTGGDAAP